MKYKTEELFNDIGLHIETDNANELIYSGRYLSSKGTDYIVFNKINQTALMINSEGLQMDLKLSNIIKEQIKELQ